MKTKPKVSVVMTTYNGEQFLEEQLNSIIAQTYPIFELIIQDDGSTDKTVEIARTYENEHDFIHVYQNKKNLGWNMNFIDAFQKAKGDYIAISDQDDIWFPFKIEKEVEAIGYKDLCFSYRFKDNEFTTNGKIIGNPQNNFECLMFTSIIPGHTMLVRTEMVQNIDEWNPYIPYDWWIAIQSYLKGGVTSVEEALNWHRPHATSASFKLMSKKWQQSEKITWQPYLLGRKAFRRYQQKEDWQWFYKYIEQHTSDQFQPKAHKLAKLLLSTSSADLLRLMLTTMKERAIIHKRFAAGKGTKKLLGAVRGFFYVFMLTYNDNMHFLRKN